MRVMLDTNIIISAAMFPHGRTSAAYMKALISPYEGIVCDYVVDELRRKIMEKFFFLHDFVCPFFFLRRCRLCDNRSHPDHPPYIKSRPLL